ncbi:MAG: DUF1559 domain-containing protein, partial [Gemmataceae bacterium]
MRSFLLAVAVLMPATLLADDAKRVVPFLDNQTLAVARFRVSRVTPASIERVADTLGWDANTRREALGRREAWAAKLAQAGVEDVYLLFGPADLHGPFAWVIPAVKPDGVADAVRSLHADLTAGMESHTKDNAVLLGSKTMLAHLKSLTPAARPDLVAALAAAGDADVQFAVSLSPEQRRVVAEMMPKLPPAFGNASTKPITAGLRWIGAGMSLSPAMSLKVVAQTNGPESTAKLKELQAQALKLLGSFKGDDNRPLSAVFGAEFDKVVQALTAKMDNDRLVIDVDNETMMLGVTKLAARFSAAALRQSRERELRDLASALHNYASLFNRLPARAGYGATDIDVLRKQGVKAPDFTWKPTPASKPLLSWRVYILPFIEQTILHREFHLDEPWDSAHNRKLISRMPAIFRGGKSRNDAGLTRILAPVIKGGIFEPDGPGTQFQEITDGMSNTILLLEAPE